MTVKVGTKLTILMTSRRLRYVPVCAGESRGQRSRRERDERETRTWHGELEVADLEQLGRDVLQLERRQLLQLLRQLLEDHVVVVPRLAEVVGVAVRTVAAAVVAGDREVVRE